VVAWNFSRIAGEVPAILRAGRDVLRFRQQSDRRPAAPQRLRAETQQTPAY